MKNWTIQSRILLLALLPGIIISLILGSFFMTQHSRNLDDLLDQRALAMAKQLAPTCEYGVMTGNSGILQNIANGMLEERDVRAVSIYNQDVEILAHAGPKMLTQRIGSAELMDNQLQLLRTDSSVRVRAPVFQQNLTITDQLSDQFYAEENRQIKLLGWAELELSTANTQLARYQHIATSSAIILLTLLICTLIALRVSRQISDPLNDILSAIGDLEDGKLDSRVHFSGGGEFQQLASGINAMASALQRASSEQQQNIEQSHRDLQETLDELEVRNRELAIGRKQALEASRMKSEFLANVSHEIRTPLNGIIGFSDLLARTRVDERQTDYLGTIRRSSTDLLKIIDAILDLSKIDAGKLIIEHAPFNLRDVIDDVLTMLAPAAYDKGLELSHIIYSEVPLQLKGDPLRLKQVLTNLINNAIKFTERGSVTLRVSLISAENQRASIKFDVQDSGLGMNEEQINRIFNAFTQADASTSRKFGGTGLGLIISRALVEAMHGEIRATSHEGRGSTFTFHIQVDVDEAMTGLAPLSGYRVLLLDPVLLNRMNISALLSNWQVDHQDFETRNQLLDHLNSGLRPDCVIVSVNRQQISDPANQAFIQRINQHGIPLIALTDSARHEHLETLKQQGASESLSQPFSHRKLHQTLRLLLTGENDEAFAALSAPQHGGSVRTPLVLAVDDNDANLKLVVTLLQELNVEVIAAHSGREAIDVFSQQTPDMVLMDIQMPGMNGLEATQAIRALPGAETLPVIALTAHAMADEKEALLKAGMNDYQTKPISEEQLAACIERWTGFRPQAGVRTPPPSESQPTSCEWVFDASSALRHASGKLDLATDMFNMLLESLHKDMQAVIDAWEEEDLDRLLETVHRIHGATRYCGVPCLRNTLDQFETALKSGASREYPRLMRQLTEDAAQLQHWASVNDWQQLLTGALQEKAHTRTEKA
ncbi:response regulator [Thalassolituus sp. LLYu03]|uniref:response regulator n=1 Tax=Thalassolituus sp. LLYu03 TaxID=3421656 RepID=UPI003D2C4C32